MKLTLSHDDTDYLKDLSEGGGLKAIERLLEALIAAEEQKVMSQPLNDGTNQKFLYDKARAEGAKKLLTSYKLALQQLKVKNA